MSVDQLISSKVTEPIFYVNFYKIERPKRNIDSSGNQIEHNKNVICWKIKDTQLSKIEKHIGIFFDSESYIVQWIFDLRVNNTFLEESLVYYWKGQQASKGCSPLPPELDEHLPVDRIVQWSEPAIFFHAFQYNFVFCGKEEAFDHNVPHLLLIRGELFEEIHFYEVECKKKNLRSKSSFLLIIPKNNVFLYWHGLQTSLEHRNNVHLIQPHSYLKKWQNTWSTFLLQEEQESRESTLFLETVEGDLFEYFHIKSNSNFSPKLYYLNSITGTFLATEIEYPLRSPTERAPFPFLQSHLYSALQPALFIVDNNTEIWLWEGIKTKDYDRKIFEKELELAKELQKEYAAKKEKMIDKTVKCLHTNAFREPKEFTNLFPLWGDS